MSLPSTSKERRELIHELLAAELRDETDEPGDTTVITSFVALVGVQTINATEDVDYSWVGRVTSHPRPPAYMITGLIEQYRRIDLASLVEIAVKGDET